MSEKINNRFEALLAQANECLKSAGRASYWRRRLEDSEYNVIQFRNGYATLAPVMVVEYVGLRRYGKGRTGYYAIRLGRVLSLKRWRAVNGK